MRIHYPHIGMLAQALKERRHFTIAEAMMARDILDEARRTALAWRKLPFADNAPQPSDAANVKALKKRGLLEVAGMIDEPTSPLDDAERGLLDALLPEALRDFVHDPGTHRTARPTISNALDADTVKRNASDAATQATLAAMGAAAAAQSEQNTALGARVESLAANVESLAGMLHTLLGQLGSPAPSAPPAPAPKGAPSATSAAPSESPTKEGAK